MAGGTGVVVVLDGSAVDVVLVDELVAEPHGGVSVLGDDVVAGSVLVTIGEVVEVVVDVVVVAVVVVVVDVVVVVVVVVVVAVVGGGPGGGDEGSPRNCSR